MNSLKTWSTLLIILTIIWQFEGASIATATVKSNTAKPSGTPDGFKNKLCKYLCEKQPQKGGVLCNCDKVNFNKIVPLIYKLINCKTFYSLQCKVQPNHLSSSETTPKNCNVTLM